MASPDWNSALSVGVEELDAQHRALFALIAEAEQATAADPASTEVEGILRRLVEYTVNHFGTEEGTLLSAGYPGLHEHRAAHQHLTSEVTDLWRRHREGDAAVGRELPRFLRAWLLQHIASVDLRYADYLAKARQEGGT